MKIVYHEKFKNSEYATNPAASSGRIESIIEELEKLDYLGFVEPVSANVGDLKLAHTSNHIKKIKNKDSLLFELASLAVGGAIESSKIAFNGEPAFGVTRPPGHHASPSRCWGFCYFNNMGIALNRLIEDDKIESAYILDFDLHIGDGNINTLAHNPNIQILNPAGGHETYMEEISKDFESEGRFDIIGVSAGFDEHVEDWGKKLTTEDYERIGSMVKEFSNEKCNGRRFAILEGGYNQKVLGKNVASFIEGFRD